MNESNNKKTNNKAFIIRMLNVVNELFKKQNDVPRKLMYLRITMIDI